MSKALWSVYDDEEFTYFENILDGSISITNYKNKTKSEVTIPKTINSKPVTHISSNTFYLNNKIETINIPSSVQTINFMVIDRCKNLKNINVDKDNMYYSSQNGVLFNKYGSKLIAFPQGRTGNYKIPNNVKTIQSNAFFNCKKLINIIIPDSIEKIENSAFRNCESIINIKIPNSIKYLHYGLFCGCKNLTKITLPII